MTLYIPQVDVVYIGNLHITHLQSVLMMFEAGKPVLCEKPMTTSVKNAVSMIQAARNKGLFLMEVHRRL
jgi:dihydrodiol dehydrogenase / D-xylose 1-dehydrogenase (NADP)